MPNGLLPHRGSFATPTVGHLEHAIKVPTPERFQQSALFGGKVLVPRASSATLGRSGQSLNSMRSIFPVHKKQILPQSSCWTPADEQRYQANRKTHFGDVRVVLEEAHQTNRDLVIGQVEHISGKERLGRYVTPNHMKNTQIGSTLCEMQLPMHLESVDEFANIKQIIQREIHRANELVFREFVSDGKAQCPACYTYANSLAREVSNGINEFVENYCIENGKILLDLPPDKSLMLLRAELSTCLKQMGGVFGAAKGVDHAMKAADKLNDMVFRRYSLRFFQRLAESADATASWLSEDVLKNLPGRSERVVQELAAFMGMV